MQIGILHTHTLIVVLYMLLHLVLVTLLVLNNRNLLNTVRGKAKWGRITLEAMMILTGLYLLISAPDGLALYNVLKYFLLVAAIGIAVVAFKRYNKALGVLSLAILVYIFLLAKQRDPMLRPEKAVVEEALTAITVSNPPAEIRGKAIYTIACQRCHSANGEGNWLKSKNLRESMLVDSDKAKIIRWGSKAVGRDSNLMPANSYLTDDQVNDVVAYINTFRK
jgi:mono/diheme cytochrome c family protein